MKIKSKDFRVREGDEANLGKWPTNVNPVYKSKEQYYKLPAKHVSKLRAQQQLLYASSRCDLQARKAVLKLLPLSEAHQEKSQTDQPNTQRARYP